MTDFILFSLVAGIIATAAQDIWGSWRNARAGRKGLDWGIVGRWLIGLSRGERVLRDPDTPPSAGLRVLGWAFHYGVGIAYAAMLPIFWGREVMVAPQILPILVIGLVVSTLAGGLIFLPGLGAGIYGRAKGRMRDTLRGMLEGHAIFTLGLGAGSLLAAQMI